MKETKNGRFAMLSMFGYVQANMVTGEGRVKNWSSHIADPFVVNGLVAVYAAHPVQSPVAMFAAFGFVLSVSWP